MANHFLNNSLLRRFFVILLSIIFMFSCNRYENEIIGVSSIKLNETEITLRVDKKDTLSASVSPSNATDKSMKWATGDAEIATVSSMGIVTGKKIGTTVITAKAGGKTASCTVIVEPTPVTSVTLNEAEVSLKAGGVMKLTVTVNPDDATDKTVTWTTSDATVVTVIGGMLTAHKVGSATITAKAGNKADTCTVTVEPTLVTSIALDQATASMKAGETVTLAATVKPDDATDKTVTWTTSDATVATVEGGKVTAKKVGTVTITAKAGEKTATCTITVVPTPVTSVTLDKTSASLKAGETVTLTPTVKPDDATDKTVTWTTNNADVATVSNGVVTAKAVGEATITATADGKSATCTITVQEDVPAPEPE